MSVARNIFAVLTALYGFLVLHYLAFSGFDFTVLGAQVKLTELDKPLAIFTFAFFFYLLARPGYPVFRFLKSVAKDFTYPVISIMVAGFLLRLVYLSYTNFDVRAHDVVGHLQYVEYILANLSFPGRGACWQCYHPPLYYALTAWAYSVLKGIGVQNIYLWLQVFSILIYYVFLYYGIRIIKSFIADHFFIIVAVALLVFWPSGIIHSARIGNDVLFYALYAGGLFYLVRWYKEGVSRDLWVAAFVAALSILTKSNGIVLGGIVGMSVLLKLLLEGRKIVPVKLVAGAAGIILLGAILGFSGGIISGLKKEKGDWLVANSYQLPANIFVGNGPENYLYFDLKSFVSEPFTSPWVDGKGRQYFWNFLFKTSLLSENEINLKINRVAASLISVLFLVFLLSFIFHFFSLGRDKLRENAVLLFNIALPLIALILFRIKIPAACSNDFRYIFPVLISFIVLLTQSFMAARDRGRGGLEIGGYLATLAFLGSVIVFFVNPAVSQS